MTLITLEGRKRPSVGLEEYLGPPEALAADENKMLPLLIKIK
jgi:hypothetical protein